MQDNTETYALMTNHKPTTQKGNPCAYLECTMEPALNVCRKINEDLLTRTVLKSCLLKQLRNGADTNAEMYLIRPVLTIILLIIFCL